MSPTVRLLTFLSLAFKSLLVLATATSPQDPDLRTLKLVHVIMRHGDRNPIAGHALSSYEEEDWLGGYGYLTTNGENQTYELGRYLRERYAEFLNPFYEASETLAWSSDTDRSIRSGISTLRGLYPRLGADRNNDSQIVPIRTVSSDSDNLILMAQKCPRYDLEFSNYLLNSRENWEWEKRGMEILGPTIKDKELLGRSLDDDKYLLDNIQIQRFHSKMQPKWVTPQVEEFIKRWFLYRLVVETRTDTMKKFRSIILQRIIEKMEECVGDLQRNEGRRTKLVLYSGHDRTLVTILNILKVPGFLRPSYASALLLELHKDSKNQDYHVKIFYRNDAKEKPLKLEITGCDGGASGKNTTRESYCFLSRFKEMMEPLFPKDYHKECQMSPGVSTHLSLVTMTMGFIIVLICYM